MSRPVDIFQVKCEIQAGKLAVEYRDGNVLLIDKQSGEAVYIATLTPQNEWVSVKEKLPLSKQNVLAYSPSSGIAEADYADGIWMQYRWSAIMHGVTHWMPLPAPPNCRPPEGETLAWLQQPAEEDT